MAPAGARRLRASIEELEAAIGAREREDAVDRARAADEAEPAARLAQAALGDEDRAQARGVHEGQAGEVEDDGLGPAGLGGLELALERGRGGQVELAEELERALRALVADRDRQCSRAGFLSLVGLCGIVGAGHGPSSWWSHCCGVSPCAPVPAGARNSPGAPKLPHTADEPQSTPVSGTGPRPRGG